MRVFFFSYEVLEMMPRFWLVLGRGKATGGAICVLRLWMGINHEFALEKETQIPE